MACAKSPRDEVEKELVLARKDGRREEFFEAASWEILEAAGEASEILEMNSKSNGSWRVGIRGKWWARFLEFGSKKS